MSGFKGLSNFVIKVDKQSEKSLHDIARLAFRNLITLSPVRLSNFRYRWLGSTKSPRLGNPYNLAFDQNPGVSHGANPTSDELSHLEPALKAKLGDDIYITNNLSYAQYLENGRSKQAPNGVLHIAAQKTKSQMS